MLKNGKPVKSLWLGGERFDKYSQDDEDALAKYKKMKAFIGTTVHVSTSDNITDVGITWNGPLIGVKPWEDEDVDIVAIRWDGDSDVKLLGWLDVSYDMVNSTSEWNEKHNDLCIVDYESI